MAATKIIGVDKILATTKFSHQQKSCADQNLAPTKIWRRQNLASTKISCQKISWRRCRRIPILFGSAESTAADFSQTSLKISFVFQMVLILCMQLLSVALPLAALLLWRTLCRTVPACCTGPPCYKMSQILAPTKYPRPPKIH